MIPNFFKRYKPGHDVPSMTDLTEVGRALAAVHNMVAVAPLVLVKNPQGWKLSVGDALGSGMPVGVVSRAFVNGEEVFGRPEARADQVEYFTDFGNTGFAPESLAPMGGRPVDGAYPLIHVAKAGDPVLGLRTPDGRRGFVVLTEQVSYGPCGATGGDQIQASPLQENVNEEERMVSSHIGEDFVVDLYNLNWVSDAYDVRHTHWAFSTMYAKDPAVGWAGGILEVQRSPDGVVWETHPSVAVKGSDGMQDIDCTKCNFIRFKNNTQSSSSALVVCRFASKTLSC